MVFVNKLIDLARRISWKTWIIVIFLLLLIVLIPRMWPLNNAGVSDEQVKPVRVLEIKEETIPISLEYMGIVNAREVKKLGFKMSGVLEKVFVTEGQPINEGDMLAQLDTTELALAVEAAQNTRDNAKTAYEFARDNYERINKLLEAGAVSKQENDRAKVEMENLLASYNNAEIDYQNKQNNLEDTVLRADISGFVAEVLYEEGEIVPSGYPVVIIRGNELEVNIGLSQNDLSKVSIGTAARIFAQGNNFSGKIKSVGLLPDSQTKTYPTVIEIEDTTLPVGMSVKVILDIGEEKGVFIPISAIKNNNSDFVYVIDKDMIAHLKTVQLGRIRNGEVMVNGFADGDKLVIEGSQRLYDGDKVSVKP